MRHPFVIRCLFLFSLAISARAQSPEPEPDVVIFTDGECLSGHLVSATSANFTFQSDALGSITADWSKVKELHAAKSFAVIPKGVEFKRNADTSAIPEGTLAVADQKITVSPASGEPKIVAVSDATNVVETGAFEKALKHNGGFFHDWTGGVSGGASFVQATQDARTFNAAVNLARIEPPESWLRRRNRTTISFSTTYGLVKQPATPSVKTSIYHGSVERDEYFSTKWYGFGQALYDHNFSQGLDLQQSYGGGLGWSALHSSNQNLDLKFGVTYVRQEFSVAANDKNLAGSTFEEDYKRGLKRGITFNQQLILNPAWNDTDALAATLSAQLLAPISKKLNFTLGATVNYLHDPPPGFKLNSLQLNLALYFIIR